MDNSAVIKEIFDSYAKNYSNFKAKFKDKLKNPGILILENEFLQVFYYPTKHSLKDSLLIIPSIINDSSIFRLNENINLVDFFNNLGIDVYLIQWKDTSNMKDIKMDNYLLEINKTAIFVGKKLIICGYCFGGILAIGALTLYDFKAIILLATPWDFTYLQDKYLIYKSFNYDTLIKDLDYVPSIYIQILFFLINPDAIYNKLQRIYDLEISRDFFTVEEWLLSANNLSKTLFEDILSKFIINNEAFKGEWCVNNTIVDIKNYHLPVFLVRAKRDYIVESNSTLSLLKDFSNVTDCQVDCGHIGFLTTEEFRNKFYTELSNWINNLK